MNPISVPAVANTSSPQRTTSYALHDTNNHLTRPSGSDFELNLPEGVYVLRDLLKLGYVPIPPSESSTTTVNVLDPRLAAATAGTKISRVVLQPRTIPAHLKSSQTVENHDGHATAPTMAKDWLQQQSHASSESGSFAPPPTPSTFSSLAAGNFKALKFMDINAAHHNHTPKESKETTKRRKPKSNIVKSSSSFVTRAIASETVSKRVQEHKADGVYIFANTSRAMHWLDFSSAQKHDPLMKILFAKAHALCHDVNTFTKASNHLDVILGFSSGDIVWYEPFSQRYSRINKHATINSSPISDIRWVPGSESMFVAAHHDGHIILYDKEREDTKPASALAGPAETNRPGGFREPRIAVKHSKHLANPKNNPVAVWKVSRRRPNGLAFSPDGSMLAVVAEDGMLRIINFEQERLLDMFQSYYGGLNCVCWSPDGRYILTGGQDDLVTIWSYEDRAVVARFQGHKSWVSCVAFDPWRCDEGNYRFGSVGEDCRLILWDFTVGLVSRPRAGTGASIRGSIGSGSRNIQTFDYAIGKSTTNPSRPSHGGDDSRPGSSSSSMFHAAEPRSAIPLLPPVMTKQIDEHAVSWVNFEEDSIVTSCDSGHIHTWSRPDEDQPTAAGSQVQHTHALG